PHRVRSLVSMMSTTGRRAALMSEPRALRALLSPAARTREAAIENAVALFRVIRSTGFPFDEASVRERAGIAWDRGYDPRGFLRQLAAIAATGDRTARLRFVRARTLVVHGSVDPLIRPLGGRLTAAAIPGARLEVIEGMGHDLPKGAWPRSVRAIASHAAHARRYPRRVMRRLPIPPLLGAVSACSGRAATPATPSSSERPIDPQEWSLVLDLHTDLSPRL